MIAIALLGVTSCSSFIDEALATTVRPMQLTAALERACASGGVIPATELIPEAWDRMLVLPDGTYGYMVNEILGFHYTHDDSYFGSRYTVILLNGERPVVEVNDNPLRAQARRHRTRDGADRADLGGAPPTGRV